MWFIKSRAADHHGGIVLMQGETYAKAAGCIGHVDCQEILSGKNSVARAVPIVEVSNDEARVTHEASVGKINQKELETLMTRGLDEEEASELIINSLLR
jgi:Fe-S cluster assembly scaffold protein SufB